MAVWCHRLDMALSDPASSGSLIRSHHQMGCLLAYFLGPGMAWRLQFEDMVTQVLKENWLQLDTKCANATTSLRRCNKRWTTLCKEIDAIAAAREMTTDPPSGQEMDARLSTLRTSLGAIERAITRYEEHIKNCRMQEEEACQVEIPHKQSEEEISDTEMVDDEEHGGPEPSDPREEADVEGLPPPIEDVGPTPLAPGGDAVSPEEDAFLMQPAPLPKGPAAGSHSPRSEAGMVSGEMAELSLTFPSQPELAEGKTPP